MKNLKKLLIVFCLSLLGICANALAAHSKDVSGYYILSTIPPEPPQYEQPVWTNTTTGTCPGITFPASVAAGEVPTPANQITIDPQSIASPYSCSTIYTLNQGTPLSKCLVSVELHVKSGVITKVNLSAISLSGQGCKPAYPNSPVIFLGNLP